MLVGWIRAGGGSKRVGDCLKYFKRGGTEKKGGETKIFKKGGGG